MMLWTYLAVFAAVIAADQLSKRWAIGLLPAAEPGWAAPGLAWSRTPSPAFERLGGRGAGLVWLLAGTGGAALCLAVPQGAVAALGGVAAWAAAGSNLAEWWRRGAVVDWVRLWPNSLTNLADAVLLAGTAQLIVWMMVA
jgi:lipoprotein signal peptidase